MRKIIGVCLACIFLGACTVAPVKPNEQSSDFLTKVTCPKDYFETIFSQPDETGTLLEKYDIDCDNICDGAALIEEGIPVAVFTCEQADEMLKLYNEMIEERDKKEKLKKGI